MTRGNKGKLFIRFVPLFTLSLFSKIVCSLCTDTEKTLKSSGKCFIYGKLLRHTNKVSQRFLLRDTLHEAFFTGYQEGNIIDFFVTRNKQPMTIGINGMCISTDDNCVNTMCFPRQLPTTARKLFTTI